MLNSNSTPTEIANFTRNIKLSQFRKALEYSSLEVRKIVVSVLTKADNITP